MFDIIQIQEILPKTYHLILVDRLTDMEDANSLNVLQTISI